MLYEFLESSFETTIAYFLKKQLPEQNQIPVAFQKIIRDLAFSL